MSDNYVSSSMMKCQMEVIRNVICHVLSEHALKNIKISWDFKMKGYSRMRNILCHYFLFGFYTK